MKLWELKHTVYRYHTFFCMWLWEREEEEKQKGRTEKKGEKMKRKQSWRGEGGCESNNGKLRKRWREKHRECTGRSHTSSVIAESSKRGYMKRKIISHFVQDTDKETVSNICHTWWWRRIKSHKRCDENDYLKKQQMDSVTVLILCVNWVMTCCLGQDPVIFYKWR